MLRLFVYQLHQDDPKKCTASKLIRLNRARPIYDRRRIPKDAILLDPYSNDVFSPLDRRLLSKGLVAVDSSWKKAKETFQRRLKGVHRRLPLLLPANPINYGHVALLSSAEALAAALYIAGYKEEARRLLDVFKWGQTFFELNHRALEEYSSARSQDEILEIEKAYFRS
ncbi:MAG: DUF367 family protein [Nitrososphaerota archaeon]